MADNSNTHYHRSRSPSPAADSGKSREENDHKSSDSSKTTKSPNFDNSEPKGPPGACLFVASLSNDTTEATLAQYFSKMGKVLKVKLMKDKASRPYAFVQFEKVESADAAIAHNQLHSIDGRTLRVEKAKVNRTLFVAKINRNWTNHVRFYCSAGVADLVCVLTSPNQDLRAVAEEYGKVENVAIIKNHQTNKSKGCGFVKYYYREDAINALAVRNHRFINNTELATNECEQGLKSRFKKWVVEWATSANDPDLLGVDKKSIFIGGLNPHLITKEALHQRFSKYGAIESISLVNPLTKLQHETYAYDGFADPVTSSASSPIPYHYAENGNQHGSHNSPDKPESTQNGHGNYGSNESSESNGTNESNGHDPTADENEPEPTPPDEQYAESATDDYDDSRAEYYSGEEPSDNVNIVNGDRSAFAFIKYFDPESSAAAIEEENGAVWMDRRIRVQYCETPEMKLRKRYNKYMNMMARYGPAFVYPPFFPAPPFPVHIPPGVLAGYYDYGAIQNWAHMTAPPPYPAYPYNQDMHQWACM